MTDYLTREEFKASLELTGQTFADNDVDAAISAASRGLEEACGRKFLTQAADETRYYTPLYPGVILIDDLYDLTSLETDTNGDGTFPLAWTENTQFLLEPLNAAADGWPWTRIRTHPASTQWFPAYYPRSVRLIGRFGWPAVPAQITEACTILATKLLRRAREAPFGIVAVGVDIGAVARIATTDPDVAFLIRPFVREKLL